MLIHKDFLKDISFFIYLPRELPTNGRTGGDEGLALVVVPSMRRRGGASLVDARMGHPRGLLPLRRRYLACCRCSFVRDKQHKGATTTTLSSFSFSCRFRSFFNDELIPDANGVSGYCTVSVPGTRQRPIRLPPPFAYYQLIGVFALSMHQWESSTLALPSSRRRAVSAHVSRQAAPAWVRLMLTALQG